MIETIIFDIGNVLVKVMDDDEFHRLVMRRLGSNGDLGPVLRKDTSSLRGQFGKGKITETEFYRAFLDKVKARTGYLPEVSEEEFYSHWNKLFLGPNESMAEVVNQLKDRRYNLQVLSNISGPWMEFAQKNYPSVFTPFDDIVASCAEDVQALKGEGLEIYAIAHARNKSERPENNIFIDDKIKNVNEGKNYGFRVFHQDLSIWDYEQATERFRGFLKSQKVLD